MDVVTGPGDVLYIPRGTLHATSTVIEGQDQTPSTHLTVGVESLNDYGTSWSWDSFFGARGNTAGLIEKSYYNALGNLIDTDKRFRKSMPLPFLKGAKPGTVEGSKWTGKATELMHAIVVSGLLLACSGCLLVAAAC